MGGFRGILMLSELEAYNSFLAKGLGGTFEYDK